MKEKGFTAEIYRSQYRSTLNVLRNAKEVTIIDSEIPAMHSPTEDAPAVRIVRRKIQGRMYVHAEPFEPGCYAFGGSFIYTSDSRIRELNDGAIPLHDRDMKLEGNPPLEITEERIKVVLAPLVKEMKEKIYTPDAVGGISDAECLGVIVSKFLEWDIDAIVECAKSTLLRIATIRKA